MARKLNNKDKTILEKYVGQCFDESCLPQEVQDKLYDTNWYETKWSDINRYLGDRATEERMNNKRGYWL